MSPHVAGTTPYPWPYDGDLAGAGTALVVVVGEDDGAGQTLLGAVTELAGAVRRTGGTVVLARTADPRAARGRRGPAAEPEPGDPPAVSTRPVATSPASTAPSWSAGLDPDVVVVGAGLDAFYGSTLDAVLRARGLSRLLIVGYGLETAVHSTLRDANDRGYECLLVVDACTPHDVDLVPASVSMVEMSGGIFGAVGRAADVLSALSALSALEPHAAHDQLAPVPT